jgi:glycolate oxidase iron-sulfur subunit
MYQSKQGSFLSLEQRERVFPDQDADRCVMCGLCLPHCPTYRLTGDESESPRGRIALMRALASAQLAPTPSLIGHLDRCLTCRACEAVCPAVVPYGALIDSARVQVREGRSRWQRVKKLLIQKWLISHPRRIRALGRLARFAQIMRIDEWARRSGLLQALGWTPLEKLLPKLSPLQRWRSFYPAQDKEQGQIALFTGCIADVVERPLLMATVKLFNHLGYSVYVPPDQVCCGALAWHEGEWEHAVRLACRNIQSFAAVEGQAVVCTASGCTVSLRDYPCWIQESGADATTASSFAYKLRDVNQFLCQLSWPKDMELKPLAKRIAVHDPCSLRHVLHQHRAVYALLRRIPAADIVPLSYNEDCCGAAGSYMLTQPELAQSLLSLKINNLREIRPDILVTSNVGCSLHLAAGVKEAGLSIEVLHPVQLLARQLNL